MPGSMHIEVTAPLEYIDGHLNVCCVSDCGHFADNASLYYSSPMYSFICIVLCISILISVCIAIAIFVVAWLVFAILRATVYDINKSLTLNVKQ